MRKIVRTLLVAGVALIALSAVFGIVGMISGTPLSLFGTAAAQEDHAEDTGDISIGLKMIGAGLAVGLSGLGAGIGEASVGAAAVGAMAEDPKMFGKGLLMTVIPETIAIFGLLVAFMIIGS